MKHALQALLDTAVATLTGTVLPEAPAPGTVLLERTRDAQHGDFSTNAALRLAKAAGLKPRELAQALVATLPPNALIARTEVAGAGFINFFLSPAAYAGELAKIHAEGPRYGTATAGQGERVLLEFVSADPTAPLHVGHGRQGAYGATLANLLEAQGYRVTREYSSNDAGRQADILALSAWLHYLELCGESLPFPQSSNRDDYVRPLAEGLRSRFKETLHRSAADVLTGLPPDAPQGDKDIHIEAFIERARSLLGTGFQELSQAVLAQMLADIRDDLEHLSVHFDHWFPASSLSDSGAIDRALERLGREGRLYRKDGAVWFRATDLGDDKDRMLVDENGVKTRFASDIAYPLAKRERGFSRLIDVRGAGHHGYKACVGAGLTALCEPAHCWEVQLIELVSLFRGEEQLRLRQLREAVGNDACRFFFLMRDHGQRLDFDLELAKLRNNDNPLYYVQYAHARVASVMNELCARKLCYDLPAGLAHVALLSGKYEQALLALLTRYPEAVEQAALLRSPHLLVQYLRELANALHTYHHAQKWIVPEEPLRHARLTLALGVQQVIRNALELLGIPAPQSM